MIWPWTYADDAAGVPIVRTKGISGTQVVNLEMQVH